ncbi:hybrid signal transduction histidine kinase A-like [Achroia grisella]|uniref:hybrid signal transduction histidine kinase A-like n=1 Tax=Achroia grisella TaxID=688607 RepID=UPI0027D31A20|nr:hybrid signal transduction histidine kinase A-like [Achroia grisella]
MVLNTTYIFTNTMAEDVVIINDDPFSAELVEVPTDREVKISNDVVDTIVIDEDKLTDDVVYVSEQRQSLGDDDIEIVDIQSDRTTINATHVTFDSVYKENKKLAEIIEKCLDLENSHGMLRVINRTLLPRYRDIDENYKISSDFDRVLNKMISLLDTDPFHKFSHVKRLCDIMKASKTRKKANLITLSNNVTGISSKKIKNRIHINSEINKPKKRQKLDNEKQDNYLEVEVPAVNLNENNIDVIDLSDEEVDDGKVLKSDDNVLINNNLYGNLNECEESSNYLNGTSNCLRDKISDSNVDSQLVVNDQEALKMVHQKISSEETTDLVSSDVHNEKTCTLDTSDAFDNNLLVVRKEIECDIVSRDKNIDRIKQIEEEIRILKINIEKLEVLEVDDDSMSSPYIQCDQMKATIVKLYKELCSLTGDEAVKRRKIRLQVMNDRLLLPVKKLEQLINDNIGSDGNPQFPDFNEVIQCVDEANKAENLGWSEAQINKEARALFMRCGHELQKYRQKREYRDLISYVQFNLEADPADEDPHLLARLEENKRHAMKKEAEILDRFVKLVNCNNTSLPPLVQSEADNNSVQRDVICTNNDTKTSELGDVNNQSNIELPVSTVEQNSTVLPENVVKKSECIENISSNITPLEKESVNPIHNIINNKFSFENSEHVERSFAQNNTITINNTESSIKIENKDNSVCNSNDVNSNNENDILEQVNRKLSEIVKTFPNSKNRNDNCLSDRKYSELITFMDDNLVENAKKHHIENSHVSNTSKISSSHKNENNSYKENCDTLSIDIKKENPNEDLLKALQRLGDSFTTTIMDIDIDDPSLIVEISSDSSDNEES